MDKNAIRIMTYNVRRCTGIDGRVSPERIAEIILAYQPDVVALQEVDVDRARTKLMDQPKRLAGLTGMNSIFFPRLIEGTEQYGIAVLSKRPATLVKADRFPTQYVPPRREVGGAIWIQLEVGGTTLQLIATHFNHHSKERLLHINTLIGPEWLKDPRCQGPVVLCGDLNTTHRSAVYLQVHAALTDAQQGLGRYEKTWPSFFPVMRIDHIFISKPLVTIDVQTPRTWTARLASDHLPLVADLTYETRIP